MTSRRREARAAHRSSKRGSESQRREKRGAAPRARVVPPRRCISATEAARNFSELLNRVRYLGDRVTIERSGVPVCEIAPATPPPFRLSEFVDLLAAAAEPDSEFWDLLEEITRGQPTLEPSPWES
ncbi:MAG: type II toxin-antitoxin system Phd/YefM family antitoxin [Candidatus Binatia bacterium]